MFKLEGTVTIPFIKKKVSKKILLFVGLAVITYYYLRKGNEAENAAQLVIGAPGPGQVSITNPNPPARRVARPKPKPVTRLGGKPAAKPVPAGKPAPKPFIKSKPTIQRGTVH